MRSGRRRILSVHILLRAPFSRRRICPEFALSRTFEAGSESKIGSQGIIDKFMRLAFGRNDVVELCSKVSHGWNCSDFGGHGLQTIPELLLIL